MTLDRWALSADVVHLNHGSYGGVPRDVLATATGWRARLEAAPMRFYVLDWQPELDRARAVLAEFVRAPDSQLVFAPNATTAIATVLASLRDRLAAGDELLTTSHAYRAVKNQLDRLAGATGARVVVAPIALPYDPEQTAAAILAAATPRTKLAVLDHITSPTALRLPIEQLAPALSARGIAVLIDGAHAPGQIELDLGALLASGVSWYAGNNHKWLCAPKASGFLVAATPVAPIVTSHGASPEYGPANRWHAELDWAGTHDPCVHLTVPTAIASIAALGGGWPDVIARNHAAALDLRDRVIDGLGGTPHRYRLADDASTGAMAAIEIALPTDLTPFALQRALLEDGWEVAIVDFAAGPLVRISTHLYNEAAQGDLLARELHRRGVRLRAAVR